MKKNINIQVVKKIFDDSMRELMAAIDKFPWQDEHSYAHWLGQSYYMTRHTTRLASYTASRIGFENEELHKHMLGHLREETGHEQLALNDVKNMDWSINQIPETWPTKLMISSQYHWISQSPYAHFGFIWVLESLASLRGQAILAKVKKRFPESCTFIEVHAEVDEGHAAQIFNEIKGFKPEEYAYVIETVEQTCRLYSHMLNEVSKFAKIPKAA